MYKEYDKGFTMVELVVAIAILGVLMVIALPTIRAIQANNKKAKYIAYEKSLTASSKLYVDSYAEDLYGRTHTGCAIIYYKDLKERDLIENIQLKNNDCSRDDTYIIVKRPKNKNDHYFPHLTCREKNSIVYGDETPATLDDSCKIEDGKGPVITIEDKSPYAKNPNYKKNQQPRINVKIEDDGIGLKASQTLKYQWYKNDVKQGGQQTLQFGNIDFETFKDKDITNLSGMASTLEDTTYKVVITGTVEDYDGNKTSTNTTMTIKYHNTKVFIKIHANGGQLTEEYDHNYDISKTTGFITYKGSEILQTVWYGEKMDSYGLVDINYPKHLNLTRTGFVINKGKEFNTKADGTGENFSQSGSPEASKFCNAESNNCTAILYVNWDDAVYTLKYDDNGGTGCSAQKVEQKYNKPWGTLCMPKNSGHTFGGWFDGTTKIDQNSKALKDVTVKAKWTAETYDISLSCPNTTCACCGKKKGTYGAAWSSLFCVPTKTGYSFEGWYDGTNQITAATKITGPKNLTCKMKPADYTLTYDDNGGTGCSDKTIGRKRDEAWGTLCKPTRKGHTFSGWSGLSSKTAVKNEHLVAQWKPETYDISLSCPNTTCACCGNKKGTYGTKFSSLLCTPTKAGYSLTGWYDEKNNLITANTTITGTKKLTCKLKPAEYTLTYEDSCGTTCKGKSIKRKRDELWGTLCTPTCTGYNFNGWTGLSSKTAVKDEKVKASWTPKTYALKINCPNTTCSCCGNKTGTHGSTWKPLLCTPTKAGYSLTGWYDGTTQITATTKITGARTINCKLKPAEYTLTYVDNCGTTCKDKSIKKKRDELWGTLCSPSCKGHTFNGWTGLSSKTAVKDEKVTASWTANTYKLTYSCSYGSCTSKNGIYNKAWGTLCSPTRAHYSFGGWYDGSTKVTATTKVEGNRKVTCKWTPRNYTLTYKCSGSTNCTSKTGTYGQTWGDLCKAKKTGYKFLNWKDGSTTVTSSTKVTGDRTVTCDMEKIKYKPKKPTIDNKHSGKWVNSSYAITAKTTTDASKLGNWYYKYKDGKLDNLQDSKGKDASGVASVTTKKFGQINKVMYVKVCSIYATSSSDEDNCSDYASTTLQIDLTAPVMWTYNKSGGKKVFHYKPTKRKPVSGGVTISDEKCHAYASNNSSYSDTICKHWTWKYKKVPYYNGEFWWGWDNIVCKDAGGSGCKIEYWFWDHEGHKSPKWCKWNRQISKSKNISACGKSEKVGKNGYDHNFFAGNDRPHYKHGIVKAVDNAGNVSDIFEYKLTVKYKGE